MDLQKIKAMPCLKTRKTKRAVCSLRTGRLLGARSRGCSPLPTLGVSIWLRIDGFRPLWADWRQLDIFSGDYLRQAISPLQGTSKNFCITYQRLKYLQDLNL